VCVRVCACVCVVRGAWCGARGAWCDGFLVLTLEIR